MNKIIKMSLLSSIFFSTGLMANSTIAPDEPYPTDINKIATAQVSGKVLKIKRLNKNALEMLIENKRVVPSSSTKVIKERKMLMTLRFYNDKAEVAEAEINLNDIISVKGALISNPTNTTTDRRQEHLLNVFKYKVIYDAPIIIDPIILPPDCSNGKPC